jgi:hypothetical protein
LRDFQFQQWPALLAPAGTLPDIVARLNGAAGRSARGVREKSAQASNPSSPRLKSRHHRLEVVCFTAHQDIRHPLGLIKFTPHEISSSMTT